MFECEINERNRIVAHLQRIYTGAEIRAHDLRRNFDKSEYKWILGVKLCYMIMPYECYNNRISSSLLFGIPVEIDYKDPEKIELWEKISNGDN